MNIPTKTHSSQRVTVNMIIVSLFTTTGSKLSTSIYNNAIRMTCLPCIWTMSLCKDIIVLFMLIVQTAYIGLRDDHEE